MSFLDIPPPFLVSWLRNNATFSSPLLDILLDSFHSTPRSFIQSLIEEEGRF